MTRLADSSKCKDVGLRVVFDDKVTIYKQADRFVPSFFSVDELLRFPGSLGPEGLPCSESMELRISFDVAPGMSKASYPSPSYEFSGMLESMGCGWKECSIGAVPGRNIWE
ncbi:unnamed protein product [Fusarium venenatum]|uniref:Uncharacterized protein n=1 Tax=Fusarium venenatum TaxID=56646 RepID=A0A2L2SQ17_9HYPO|nr:uncharacterized protein FVRRES_12745 [Fusarium venenatum]CEI40054.1 unnamed protein product [Fusarium venenatum]